MNFTPKKNVGSIVGGALTIAVVGLIGWVHHVAPVPMVAAQNTSVAQESFQTTDHIPIISAVEAVPAPGLRTDYYQPVSSWYRNRHWWKRNAPIVGGAGGGALIGGLAGGGTGALIGGAVGGGGGYLYKRSRRHHSQ